MNVIAPRTLRTFWERHPQAETSLKSWQKLMQSKSYRNWSELKLDWPSADYIWDRKLTVFNIGGNRYRLVAFIRFQSQTVFIKHVFTHAEYDKWNRGIGK